MDAEGELRGIVTQLDLLRAFEGHDEPIFPPYEEAMRRPVSDVMSTTVRTVNPRTPVTRVLTRMVDTRSKSFPVVDARLRVIGIVARRDVMRAVREATAGARPGPDKRG